MPDFASLPQFAPSGPEAMARYLAGSRAEVGRLAEIKRLYGTERQEIGNQKQAWQSRRHYLVAQSILPPRRAARER
jgi:hypothetical protein